MVDSVAAIRDVIIVGAGPAGLASAAVLAEGGTMPLLVDRMGPGGLLMNLDALHGLSPDAAALGTTGPDLIAALTDRALAGGTEIAIDEIARVETAGGRWQLDGADGRYAARVLIWAAGRTSGTTGLVDEARFEGRGLSRCAHCDGPLHAGGNVLVAGDGGWEIEEAIALAEHAASVTLVTGPDGIGPEARSRLANFPQIALLTGSIVGMGGTEHLERVAIATPDGDIVERPVTGLFLYGNRGPAMSPVAADALSDRGLILAGDVRSGAEQTVAAAIADGRRAGQDALRRLSEGLA